MRLEEYKILRFSLKENNNGLTLKLDQDDCNLHINIYFEFYDSKALRPADVFIKYNHSKTSWKVKRIQEIWLEPFNFYPESIQDRVDRTKRAFGVYSYPYDFILVEDIL